MKQNYHCASSGEITSGEYGEIRVSGSAKMTGDVVCDSLRVSGSVKAAGDLTCGEVIGGEMTGGELSISGDLKVEGAFTAAAARISGGVKTQGNVKITEKLSLSGGLQTEGDMQLAEAKISGGLTCEGKLEAGTLAISGSLKSGDDVSAEAFSCSGKTEISGLLNAETITLSLCGRSEIENIGCTSLKVKKNPSVLGIGSKPSLTAESIEGDTIELEYTEAEVVRGKNVVVGAKCKIGRVEYSESLDIRDGGEVAEQVKV